jgi:sugar phosphate isomerase/epimerase
MRLAFSTLACPAWKWEQAVESARSLGYDGIEWRLIDGATASAALPPATFTRIRAAMDAAKLESCALDSGIQLALPPGEERRAMVAEATGMLPLARELRAGFLRVFIGRYPAEVPGDRAVGWVAEGLSEILPTAEKMGVKVALEVHSFEGRGKNVNGESDSSLCRRVVAAVGARSLGILWDVGNPYDEGEPLAETWDNVKDHLLYLHMKDMKQLPGGGWKYVLNGEGDIDLPGIMTMLRSRRFDGWLSYEWEKKWHPELAEPEVALPHYVRAMRAL